MYFLVRVMHAGRLIQKNLDFHFRPGKPVNAALKKMA